MKGICSEDSEELRVVQKSELENLKWLFIMASVLMCSLRLFSEFNRFFLTTPCVRDVDIWSQLVVKKSEATGTKENYCDEKQLKACVLTRLSGGSFDLLCRREARVFNRCSLNVQKQSADYWSSYS